MENVNRDENNKEMVGYINFNHMWYRGACDKNGIPHGKGRAILHNTTHQPEDTWEGTPPFVGNSGYKYEGEFKNGKANGFGILTNNNNTIIYKGDWKDGLRHGRGEEYNNLLGFIYSGSFVNNQKDGYGAAYQLFAQNGGFRVLKDYEGYWKNGRKNGKGTRFVDGKPAESGTFFNGQLTNNGYHVLYCDGKKLYEGYYQRGMPNDKQGKFYNNGYIYEGNVIDGNIEGNGKITNPYGSYYEGQVYNGRRNGWGKEYDNEGHCIYQGQWLDDKTHGMGRCFSGGYKIYEGYYANGAKDGCGREFNKDGTVKRSGTYQHGKYFSEDIDKQQLEKVSTTLDAINNLKIVYKNGITSLEGIHSPIHVKSLP